LNTSGHRPARPRAVYRGADQSRTVGRRGPGAGRPKGAAGSAAGLVPERRLL